MDRIRLKIWLVAAAAVLSGLAAFLCISLTPPAWEARALVRLSGPAAEALPGVAASAQFSRHIRELTDFDGFLSAVPIPGTCLVTLFARDDTGSHAAAGLDAARNQLETVLRWIGDGTISPVVVTEPAPISGNPDFGACLAAALAGGLLAALWLFPLPTRQEPLDLWEVLRRWVRLAKRQWAALLMFCLLFGCGNILRQTLADSPAATASALVSIGEYQPDSAKALSATVSGLLSSDLMTVKGITAEQIGQSNLFILAAAGVTPADAGEKLNTTMAVWPELAVYSSHDLTLQQHQPTQLISVPPISPAAAWGIGILLGAVFGALLLFAAACTMTEKIDTVPCEAYNKSQS